jgi:hypothetical protein
MKRIALILVFMLTASHAWAARKVTVEQLQDLLHSLHQANKTDAETAAELQQVELTEELTRSAMDSLTSLVPGPLTTDQMYVQEARSAMLAPPASDLPSTPAPDAAAQKALLDKAIDYATKTYAQLPHLTAAKSTFRFQDILNPPGTDNSKKGPAKPAVANGPSIYYVGTSETPVESQGGAVILSPAKDDTHWGANGQITLQAQGPVLSTVAQEAEAAGKINWLRWETVNGKQTAVFSFAVDKKKSHYAVKYCCFPDSDQGSLNLANLGVQPGMAGNLQAEITWVPYKATVPYHGELFVDAQSGIVVRLVTEADLKPYDTVHQEDTRIDYGAMMIGGKPMIVPVGIIIDTGVNAGEKDIAGKLIPRRTLFIADYKDYKQAGASN